MGLFFRKKQARDRAEQQPAQVPGAGSSGEHQNLKARPVSAATQPSTLSRQSRPAENNTMATQAQQAEEAAQAKAVAAAGDPAADEAPKEPKRSFWERHFPGVDWCMARIRLVFGLFLIAFVGLWCRAWYLQMIAGPSLAEYARRQHITSEIVTGKRGMILDRDGQVLARSVEALSVYANPGEISDFLTTANTLGPILGIAPQKLFDQLSQTRRQFVWLKRKVDDYTADAVRRARLPGIGLSKEYERVYPFKHMAGQLLGFVGYDDKGLEGLERAMNSRLASAPMRQIVQRDATGRRFYMRREGEEDPHGDDIQLTLDVQMQFFAEEAVARVVREEKARWGGALVVHVPSGEILAWAQYPFFNPNNFRSSRPELYRNRLAQDALEPGSTFKPFVLAAAMQERKVSRSTIIDCEEGRWETKYVTIRDTSRKGKIPVYKVLRYSSNIGMAKIGLMMGNQTMYRYLHRLGFGERTNVPVAENRGILRKPRDWSEVDCMSISFGQGVSVTGLQMAQAYLTLLNNGIKKNLVLVKGHQQPEERVQIFAESVTRDVQRMMREVVEEKDGTGRRAAIPGISVAGKTGTAQKADIKSGSYGSKRMASFVGFLPAEKPLYLILVFIDEPQHTQYGGVIAAPVFREIAERALAYAGILSPQGRAGTARAEVQKSGDLQVRGLKMSGLDSPFVRTRQQPAQGLSKSQRAELSNRPANAADALRLPGHLARPSATVPDVTGKTLRNAVELFARAGIVPELKGEGMRVVRQSPAAGSPWPEEGDEKARYILWLSDS